MGCDAALPRACCPLLGPLFAIVLIHLPSGASGQFQVTALTSPVWASIGGEAILSCQVSPRGKAEAQRWFHSHFKSAILLQGDWNGEQPLAEYQNRTELMDPSPNDDPGTVSLRIRDIRVSDNGTYTCYFKSVSYYHSATVQLQVTALGSALHLHLKDYEEGGIQVLCHSAGWFPTPLLQWKKLGHEQEPYASKVQITEDGDGLFGVEGALILKESDPVSWVCHVSSGLKNQEREARFSVADVIFPHHSPMLLILPLFLVALVLLTLVCLILLRRQLRENGRLLLVKENLLAENVKLKKERDAMVSDQGKSLPLVFSSLQL
uniref:Ig-like domain-containing protein n=1 Tax=Ornithorhynchus anatinus TaxID=9258 RepID=A0A6I8PQ38_ORNAN